LSMALQRISAAPFHPLASVVGIQLNNEALGSLEINGPHSKMGS